ncbi:sterol desaturase [Lecanosticta acicola]|uniref:Sterol desaturase n=1 Tax=Lecanosticta acicola TaxID=111012 RepID=A0AAI8Z1P7_9PEZI|nr:sterol desaturase [Lecanosticta acicola]
MPVLQEYWTHVVQTYPPNWIELGIVLGAQVLGYWLPSAIFLAVDLGFPRWSSEHKLRSEKRQPSLKSILHCLRYVSISFAVQTSIQLLMQMDFSWAGGKLVVRKKANPTPFRGLRFTNSLRISSSPSSPASFSSTPLIDYSTIQDSTLTSTRNTTSLPHP